MAKTQGADRVELGAGPARVRVDPARGGMIESISIRGHDLLVSPAGEWRPYPRWGSFVMAPWVGLLWHGQLSFRGSTYSLRPNEGAHANHGLVAGVPWRITNASARGLALERSLDELWPLGGTVRQQIALSEDELTLAIEIEAGGHAMPAAAGWHPWFRRRAESAVRVRAEQLLAYHEGRPTGMLEPVSGPSDLREMPLLADRRIDVVYAAALPPATLSDAEITLDLDFDRLIETVVVYTPPDAVCVEPWSSWPEASRLDAAGSHAGLVELEPGEVFRRSTSWRWRIASELRTTAS